MPDPNPNPAQAAPPNAGGQQQGAAPGPNNQGASSGGQQQTRQQNGTPPQGGAPQQQGTQQSSQSDYAKAMHEERERRQALQTEVDRLNAEVQGYRNTQQYQQPQGQAGTNYNPQGQGQQTQYGQNNNQHQGVDVTAQLDELWANDPRAAMRQEMGMAFQWYDQVNVQLEAQENTMVANEKYKDYPQYKDRVRAYIRTLPVEQRAKPGIMELAYYVVRGQAANTMTRDEAQAIVDRYKQGEQTQGVTQPANSGGAPDDKPTLSEDEKKAALVMGMTDEEYLKHKK